MSLNSAMAESRNDLLKKVVALKREHHDLEEVANLLQRENFEYALKCNRIENVIRKIEANMKGTPANLVQASANLYKILETCSRLLKTESDFDMGCEPETPVNRTEKKSPLCNKVKPHMVNGHVLFEPTINLTRVSDLNVPSSGVSTAPQESVQNSSLLDGNDSLSSLSSGQSACHGFETEPDDETKSDVDTQTYNVNNISHSSDTSEPSTSQSTSHSTVLSGTFQEVKIYLNQISPEYLNQSSRNSSVSRRSKNLTKRKNKERETDTTKKRKGSGMK